VQSSLFLAFIAPTFAGSNMLIFFGKQWLCNYTFTPMLIYKI
jgi:hypothetical protein